VESTAHSAVLVDVPFFEAKLREEWSHRNFSVSPPVCRKAPAAVAVQGRHQAPPRLHRGAGRRRGCRPIQPPDLLPESLGGSQPGEYTAASDTKRSLAPAAHRRNLVHPDIDSDLT
jgi:hypothetical protein